MYKKDLALNNLQWLICHENKPKLGDPDEIDYFLVCIRTEFL